MIDAKTKIEQDLANHRYNPLNDVLFKFIFGREERKEILIGFLNAVLDRDGAEAIKDLHYQNNEIVPEVTVSVTLSLMM